MATPLDRAAFPVTERWNYLNHAGVNAMPNPVVDAVVRAARDCSQQGSLCVTAHNERAEEVRAACARLMGVPATDVAFVKNTTEGLGFVANGLTWQPGDRVVVPDHEFPSTVYPWLALRDLGVTVDLVPVRGEGRTLPVEAFAEIIDTGPPPKLVATSWVQFGRGWRTDLAALAELTHARGGLLCADVIQGLGVLPAQLDAWGVDFASADAHKWLLGPSGIGVLYVRGDQLDRLRPLEPGWASVAHREEWDNRELVWDDTARRLEGGSTNFAGVHGLGAAVDLLLAAGIDAVWQHVDGLCDRLVSSLQRVGGAKVVSDRSPEGRSGVVTFEMAGRAPADVTAALERARIVCSPRGDGIRVSPHGFNTADEIDHLVDEVSRLG